MKPERIHVERSGMTFVPAIRAKEGINAAIKADASGKALVRNLPRDSTKLDIKQRNPAKTFVASDVAALLRVKDHEIQKLKKEVLELTEQLRHAHSRIQDLQQMAGEEKVPMEEDSCAVATLSTDWTGQHQYPKLRIRCLSNSRNVTPEGPMSSQATCQDSAESSDASLQPAQYNHADENLFQLDYFNRNLPNCNPSQPLVREEESKAPPHVKTEKIENQSLLHEESTVKLPDENSEDYCKEVQCIETENSSLRYPDPNLSDRCPERYETSAARPESRTTNLEPTGVVKAEDRSQEVGESSFSSKEDKEPNKTLPHCVISSPDISLPPPLDKDISYLARNTAHLDLVSPSPEKPSPWLLGKDATPIQRGVRLIRSRSCRASLMTPAAFPWFDKDERITSTPSNWFEKESVGTFESNQTTPFSSQYGGNNDWLSPNGLCQSMPSSWLDKGFTGRTESLQRTPDESQASGFGLNVNNVEASTSKKPKEFTSVDVPNTTAYSKNDKQTAHHLVNETEKRPPLPTKVLRDVTLDPMQDYLATLLAWPMEFKRLQKEIIELWHACNVSLSHRTYFFLIHRGDQKDYTYLEVEHRRLLFLKESYSRGNKTVEDGGTQTLASSLRALNRERHKLSEQMQKRLSGEERESLFQRWGIGLKTKHRRMQLANRLWSESKDMEHIKESAAVVGKLLGYVDIHLVNSKDNTSVRNSTSSPRRSRHQRRSSLSLSIL